MSTSFTPGPYRYNTPVKNDYGIHQTSIITVGAPVQIVGRAFGKRESIHAQADLFSASPDMLEALKDLTEKVQQYCSIGGDPLLMPLLESMQNAAAAIAKAESK